MGALDVSDIELGRMVGETRQTIHRKKTGRSALTADNISDYAAALGIDPDVLMRRPSAAIAWLAQHRSEQLDALELPPGRQGELSNRSDRSRCTGSRLYFQLYRSMMGASEDVVRAA